MSVPQRSRPIPVPPRTNFIPEFFSSPRVWLVAVLLLAWTLRLFHLGAMSIWWDESLSWERAQQDLWTILSNKIQIQSVTTRDLHPPLYFVLLHFAVLAFGATEFALRVLSTMANVLTVALLYPLVQLLARISATRGRPRVVGILAALFAALSPFYVWYSQEARPYALVLFWSLFAIYTLVKWLALPQATNLSFPLLTKQGHRAGYLVLYFFALAATLATHYLSFLLLPFHAATILVFGKRQDRAHVGLAFALLAAFGAAFLFFPSGAAQVTGSDVSGPTFVPFFIILRDMLNSFAIGVTASLDRAALLDLALLALWLLGVASTVRVRPRDFRLALFLLAYLLLPALALQAGSYLRPLYLNSRHLITTSPAFYLGIACGIDALARRASGARGDSGLRYGFAGITASGLVIIGAAYSLNNLYFDSTFAKDDHRGWAEFLRERMRADDFLILDSPQAETVFRYYAPPGVKWISLPHLGFTEQNQDEEQRLDFSAVADASHNYPRIWYLQLHRAVADPNNHISDLLRRFGQVIDTTLFAGTSTQIILQQFVPGSVVPTRAPALEHPLAIHFGDNLQLIGYDSPRELDAGARGGVKLYWRLDQPSQEDFGVSLRVVDEAGARWGQWDSQPVGNRFTATYWPTGQTIVETHDLPAEPGAPPGKYHVELSVFHYSSGEAFPARPDNSNQSESAIRLGDIFITRPAPPLDPRRLVFDRRAGAEFGEALDFIGYDVDTARVHPGDLIALTLFFHLLKNPNHDLNMRVALTPSPLAFWNLTRAESQVTLPLSGRVPGDILQARVQVRVPAAASAGEYSLRLGVDGEAARGFIFPSSEITIGSAQIEPTGQGNDK